MFKKTGILLLILLLNLAAKAQAPGGVPYGDPKAIQLSPFNIIIYIVLPLLLILFYFWYRNRKKK